MHTLRSFLWILLLVGSTPFANAGQHNDENGVTTNYVSPKCKIKPLPPWGGGVALDPIRRLAPIRFRSTKNPLIINGDTEISLANSPGTVYQGKLPDGTKAAIIDVQGSLEKSYKVYLRFDQRFLSWDKARDACQALGKDWDLPVAENRLLLSAIPQFIWSGKGAFRDLNGNVVAIFALWLRASNEDDSEELFEDFPIAYNYTLPTAFEGLLFPNAPFYLSKDTDPKHANVRSQAGMHGIDLDRRFNLLPEVTARELENNQYFIGSYQNRFNEVVEYLYFYFVDPSELQKIAPGSVDQISQFFSIYPGIRQNIRAIALGAFTPTEKQRRIQATIRQPHVNWTDFYLGTKMVHEHLTWKQVAVNVSSQETVLYVDPKTKGGGLHLVCEMELAKFDRSCDVKELKDNTDELEEGEEQRLELIAETKKAEAKAKLESLKEALKAAKKDTTLAYPNWKN